MRLLQLLFALRQVGLGVPNRSMCGGCFWLIYLAVGLTEGLVDVILYHQPDDKKKNRGFCFHFINRFTCLILDFTYK